MFSFCFGLVFVALRSDNSNDNKFNVTFLLGSFKTIVFCKFVLQNLCIQLTRMRYQIVSWFYTVFFILVGFFIRTKRNVRSDFKEILFEINIMSKHSNNVTGSQKQNAISLGNGFENKSIFIIYHRTWNI